MKDWGPPHQIIKMRCESALTASPLLARPLCSLKGSKDKVHGVVQFIKEHKHNRQCSLMLLGWLLPAAVSLLPPLCGLTYTDPGPRQCPTASPHVWSMIPLETQDQTRTRNEIRSRCCPLLVFWPAVKWFNRLGVVLVRALLCGISGEYC